MSHPDKVICQNDRRPSTAMLAVGSRVIISVAPSFNQPWDWHCQNADSGRVCQERGLWYVHINTQRMQVIEHR